MLFRANQKSRMPFLIVGHYSGILLALVLKKKYDDEELKEIGGKRTMSSQRRALYRKFQGASKERSTLILTDPAFVTYLYSGRTFGMNTDK